MSGINLEALVLESENNEQKRLNKLKVIAVTVIILILLLFLFLPTKSVYLEADFSKVVTGDFTSTITAQGEFHSEAEKIISALHSGVVVKVNVRPGAKTIDDQVLIELSNNELNSQYENVYRDVSREKLELLLKKKNNEIELVKQESNLSNLIGQVDIAKIEHEASLKLLETDIVTQLDVKKAAVKVADLIRKINIVEREINLARENKKIKLQLLNLDQDIASAQLNQINKKIESLTVRQVGSGVIKKVLVKQGEKVESGEALLEVFSSDSLYFKAKVLERDAKNLVVGQYSKVTVDEYKLDGEVVRIDPQVEGGWLTIDIAVENVSSLKILPLSVGEAKVNLSQKSDAILIEKINGFMPWSNTGIWVLDKENTLTYRQIKLAGADKEFMEVTSGVFVGERVLNRNVKDLDINLTYKIEIQ